MQLGSKQAHAVAEEAGTCNCNAGSYMQLGRRAKQPLAGWLAEWLSGCGTFFGSSFRIWLLARLT